MNRWEEVVLATKGGLRVEGGQMLRDSSPEWLRQSVEESLRYLGTDYIDSTRSTGLTWRRPSRRRRALWTRW
jgi:aryl-alcohol dehydrogenase-like predicted oxidoreductase